MTFNNYQGHYPLDIINRIIYKLCQFKNTNTKTFYYNKTINKRVHKTQGQKNQSRTELPEIIYR